MNFLRVPSLVRPLSTRVQHVNPIFSKELLQTFFNSKLILDATFGDGGHTKLILQNIKEAKIIAADCDLGAFKRSQDLQEEYSKGQLRSVRSRFSELPSHLKQLNVLPGSLDGMIIDTGCSLSQYNDKKNGFGPRKSGILDLRFDADLNPDDPTATQALQVMEERSLFKMLRGYGVTKYARHIVHSIIEARYAFQSFDTIQDLFLVIQSACNEICSKNGEDPRELPLLLLQQTLTALRIFVNDEMNELDFALRAVAEHFIKPNGKLFLIIHNRSEEKVAYSSLEELMDPLTTMANIKMDKETTTKLQSQHPWKMVSKPIHIPEVEKSFNPRLASSVLYIVERTKCKRPSSLPQINNFSMSVPS